MTIQLSQAVESFGDESTFADDNNGIQSMAYQNTVGANVIWIETLLFYLEYDTPKRFRFTPWDESASAHAAESYHNNNNINKNSNNNKLVHLHANVHFTFRKLQTQKQINKQQTII